MKCAIHPDRDATGYCRTCGKPLCTECTRNVRGALYCEGCLAERLAAAGPVSTPAHAAAPNPGVAAVLGFIPGLGAIYNGEYVKGLIHIAIFAGIIAVMNAQTNDSLQVFFALGLACFYLYMPIEAYRTAKMKQAAAFYGGYAPPQAGAPGPGAAAPIPDAASAASFSGPSAAPFSAAPVVPGAPMATPQVRQGASHNPMAGAIVLIVIGVLVLLANLGLLSGNWLGRWWPLILIGLGIWLFWKRNYERGRTPQR
jgi:hypothetical protein